MHMRRLLNFIAVVILLKDCYVYVILFFYTQFECVLLVVIATGDSTDFVFLHFIIGFRPDEVRPEKKTLRATRLQKQENPRSWFFSLRRLSHRQAEYKISDDLRNCAKSPDRLNNFHHFWLRRKRQTHTHGISSSPLNIGAETPFFSLIMSISTWLAKNEMKRQLMDHDLIQAKIGRINIQPLDTVCVCMCVCVSSNQQLTIEFNPKVFITKIHVVISNRFLYM